MLAAYYKRAANMPSCQTAHGLQTPYPYLYFFKYIPSNIRLAQWNKRLGGKMI